MAMDTTVLDPGGLDFMVRPRAQLYLGLNPANGNRKFSTVEDSLGILGPPRYGKTSGLLIPIALHWAGPAVVISTRADLLEATGNHRGAMAAPYGGRVHVYDPFGSTPGITSMRWTPLDGCTDPELVYRRVAEMTAVAGSGVTDAEHWRTGAAGILRGVMHAAALAGRPLVDVADWLGAHDVGAAIEILNAAETPARRWAGRLAGLDKLSDKERGSFFSVASQCLEAIESPMVEASTQGSDIDIDAFLDTSSTLYIVSPSHYQDALAPMIVALLTAITQRASELAQARGGRVDPPLLVLADEFANTAPLKGASGLASEGAGRGIVLVWAAQNLDRVRERYGADEAMAILGASTAKIVFGGLTNSADLDMFSSWEGEVREAVTTTHSGESRPEDKRSLPVPGQGGVAETRDTARQSSHTWQYRRVLPVDRLRQMPEGRARLWYRSEPAAPVWTPPAGLLPPFARLAGYTPEEAPR